MKLDTGDFDYFGRCLQGFFFGTILILQLLSCLKLLKQSNINPTGIYSGIFSMYEMAPIGGGISFFMVFVYYISYVGLVLLLRQRILCLW